MWRPLVLCVLCVTLVLITIPLSNSKAIPVLSAETLCKKCGFFRNPYDCTLYYRCYPDGMGGFVLYDYREHPCGQGLIFDEKKEVCSFPSWTEPCHNIQA